MKIIPRASQKITPWLCQQMELPSPHLEPFHFNVLTVSSSQVWSDRPMCYQRLRIDAKTYFHCCETWPKTRFIFTVNNRGTYLAHRFLIYINMRCTSLFDIPALSAEGHSITHCFFSTPFQSLYFVEHCDVRRCSFFGLV